MFSKGVQGGYASILKTLSSRLTENPRQSGPALVQLLTGPRQVGKTTLLLALAKEHEDHALYVAGDAPEAALPGFWEQLWIRAQELAASKGRAVVLLDEVQVMSDWAGGIKVAWDRFRRKQVPVHVVATGSSALRLARGTRESLAGRFERLTLSHWDARALVDVFGLGRSEAALEIVLHGAYPGAFHLRGEARRWAAYIGAAILEPAIGRDILSLAPIRKPALLRQVFAVAAASPSQILSLQKIQGQLQESGALETIAHYLSLLEDAYLTAALSKQSERATRRRASPPKLVTLSNALIAITDPRGTPDPRQEPARFGVWLENACLAHAHNSGQHVQYWREEPLEVDGVIDGEWGSWAIEVKYGSVQVADLRGLLEFHRRFPKYRPILIGTEAAKGAAERAGIAWLDWQDYLLRGFDSLGA